MCKPSPRTSPMSHKGHVNQSRPEHNTNDEDTSSNFNFAQHQQGRDAAAQPTPRKTPINPDDAISSSSLASSDPNQELRSNIKQPNTNDVLCGRGGGINRHAGNLLFRRLVEANKPLYQQSERHIKPLVAKSIVQALQTRGGRFLKEQSSSSPGKRKSNSWIDIGTEAAILKSSHALREKSKDVRESLKVGQQQLMNLGTAASSCEQYNTADIVSTLAPPAAKKQKTMMPSRDDSTRTMASIPSTFAHARTKSDSSSSLSLPPFPKVSVQKRKALTDSFFLAIESNRKQTRNDDDHG